jgi:phosphohistidine phosphatase SixA
MKKIINSPEGIIEVDLTAEEIAQRQIEEQAWLAGAFDRAINELRVKRNRLLADSDYVVLADSPVTDKANWITYRQALRDITNGLTTIEQVNNITWPNKP